VIISAVCSTRNLIGALHEGSGPASRHGAQIPRKFLDRVQEHFGFGGAEASGGGKRAKNADGAHSGAASHFDVFSRIANVHAILRISAEAFERQLQRGRMRFFLRGVFAANARGEITGEFELAQLAAHALAISAGDDAEVIFLSEEPDDAARACEQRRVFQFVGAHPEAIGFEPFGAREHCGAVNAQPIGRIVLREFALGPVDTHSMKHPEIGAEVGFVGIQERAVPVEEDCACGERCDFHGVGIVSDLSDCEK